MKALTHLFDPPIRLPELQAEERYTNVEARVQEFLAHGGSGVTYFKH